MTAVVSDSGSSIHDIQRIASEEPESEPEPGGDLRRRGLCFPPILKVGRIVFCLFQRGHSRDHHKLSQLKLRFRVEEEEETRFFSDNKPSKK
ncbi:unnamed protein product [Allacma fusca]|uniref:Uncharacterized protein n=1 Tax=Allacma fusca TaxID=39272 RepID=A0A8J2P5K8_9HEXA|nr:unnamed protein product [Allacma fusca]